MLVDTRGTGKRASALARETGLAELIAEHEMLPRGRVDVTPDRIAGRMWITIRRADPWAKPIPHPLTIKNSPYARHVPYPATIREPLTIGIDPETGAPLQVRAVGQKGRQGCAGRGEERRRENGAAQLPARGGHRLPGRDLAAGQTWPRPCKRSTGHRWPR